ncbi:isochorismatase family protein [Methylocystis bryophila]|uniref:Isochorismatase n=1 Tax=Methylocystis bryophila TaxID=655015 RepID=A0A1W6MUS0_9HYPH|nr:isochorismatase family protein [Methylocystis bryophila]ARN81343.1 isochorismatase [Methylocystis bryophila]BDV37326.1 isochorismatase [Methylocystis bryophila]
MFEPQAAVLIPIDMQQAFDLPGRPRRWNADLDRNGLALLTAWRAKKLPIIHVINSSANAQSCFHHAHPGHGFRPGFAPQDGEELVDKSVNSAFIGTDLSARLHRLGAGELVLFGMRTDMCVSSTTRSGANLGWRVTVVGDACDCCDLPDVLGDGIVPAEQAHRVHLATLADEFADVVTTSQACARLEGFAPSC